MRRDSRGVGRAKIGNIPVFKDKGKKDVAYKLAKNEGVVILGETGDLLEVQGEKGPGWVDGRMIAR